MSFRKNLRDFTIGADPEFVAVVDGKGSQAFDASREMGDWEFDAFGTDGCSDVLEARPMPSYNPIEVVTNIRQIFLNNHIYNNSSKILNFQWFAGSYYTEQASKSLNNETYGYPLGGHIHFGIPDWFISCKEACNNLSQYVGACSMLIEHKGQGLKRREKNKSLEYHYGKFIDFRKKTYGFEYRTPSSWVTSPYVAAAMLCLAKTVMFEVLNNKDFKTPAYILPKHLEKMDTDFVRKKFPSIWQDISKMHLYSIYKPYIDFIHYLVERKLTWFPKVSMKEAWGVNNIHKVPLQKVTMETIWQPYNDQPLS